MADSNRVHAVGIGPGDLDYLTARGRERIASADVVVGFETVTEYVHETVEGDVLPCGYKDEADTLAAFADRVDEGETGVAVLMGDPNFSGYQFLEKVEAAVDQPVHVIPGISSLQMAASRARTPMEETTFVTLHKNGSIDSDLDRLARDAGDRHLLVLPRPFDWMPERIADFLLDRGASPELKSFVFERLTMEGESTTRTTLGDLAASAGEETAFSDLSVLAVRRQS